MLVFRIYLAYNNCTQQISCLHNGKRMLETVRNYSSHDKTNLTGKMIASILKNDENKQIKIQTEEEKKKKL